MRPGVSGTAPICPPADRMLGPPTLTLLGLLRLAGHSCVPPAPRCALLLGGPRHVMLQMQTLEEINT